MRRAAAKALGNLGRADDRVIDALLRRLEDEERWVRDAAYSSLQKLAGNQAKETSVKLPLSPYLSLD